MKSDTHFWSSAFVKEVLETDETALISPHLDWKKLTRFHGVALLAVLRGQLAKLPSISDRETVWSQWSRRLRHLSDFFFKGGHAEAFWDIWAEFPALSNRQGREVKTNEEVENSLDEWDVSYPPSILSEEDFQLHLMVRRA